MSQQIALRNRRAHLRFFSARTSKTVNPGREATPDLEAPDSAEGLVDMDALQREVVRMKAAQIDQEANR